MSSVEGAVLGGSAESLEAVSEGSAETLEAVLEGSAETLEAVLGGSAETLEAVLEGSAETLEAVLEGSAETIADKPSEPLTDSHCIWASADTGPDFPGEAWVPANTDPGPPKAQTRLHRPK